jgi:hypothetical protein
MILVSLLSLKVIWHLELSPLDRNSIVIVPNPMVMLKGTPILR